MANLLCLMLGHKKTLVPFSSDRYFCRRCGLDVGVTVETPTVPALPPMIVKRGAGRQGQRAMMSLEHELAGTANHEILGSRDATSL